MKAKRSFHQCHLKILRSLYVDHGGGGKERRDDATSLALGEGPKDKSNHVEGEDNVPEPEVEGPVASDTWGLVERFLQRRTEYRPLEDLRIRWSNTMEEAQSRLNHVADSEDLLPKNRSLTPRTPTFSVSGRGSAALSTSLTPLSSNKKAPNPRESSQRERAWNVISHMLQKRTKLCIDSCQSFRSQPFLVQLLNEAKSRCAVLKKVLARLKVGTPGIRDVEEGPARKRRKLTDHSSLKDFFSADYAEFTTKNAKVENHVDENVVMETQMKLHLWSSLLSSVKEIVEDSDSNTAFI